MLFFDEKKIGIFAPKKFHFKLKLACFEREKLHTKFQVSICLLHIPNYSEKQNKNFRANMHFNECTRTIFTESTWNIGENYRFNTVVANKRGAIGLLRLQYFVLLYLSSHDFWSCHNLTSVAALLQHIMFSSYFSWSF